MDIAEEFSVQYASPPEISRPPARAGSPTRTAAKTVTAKDARRFKVWPSRPEPYFACAT
jgi:hypothetical protein